MVYGMKIKQTIRYFGSQSNLAAELGLDRRVVNNWSRRGSIPEIPQYKIQMITNGKLKVDKGMIGSIEPA